MTGRPAKLMVATTSPLTPWGIMRGQLRFLSEQGYEVVLVTSPGDLLDATATREGVRARPVPMEREISLLADLRALCGLVRIVRDERPHLSMVSTPKAGLLAGLAAWLVRVPTRIYVLRGLRLETVSGIRWALLWVLEWVSLHVAQQVIVVSPSLLVRARRLRLLGRSRGVVLGAGASNGVDIARFAPTPERVLSGRELRARLGIPESAFVFGYVGRPSADKGTAELAEAFAEVAHLHPRAWLLMVGPADVAEARSLEGQERVRFTGWLTEPDAAYHAMDVLVLPTYREGFPNVCIEAGAAGKAVITTTATGALDSIEDEVTGILVPPRDPAALGRAMHRAVSDPDLTAAMGDRGRIFVAANFTNERIWTTLASYLNKTAVGISSR